MYKLSFGACTRSGAGIQMNTGVRQQRQRILVRLQDLPPQFIVTHSIIVALSRNLGMIQEAIPITIGMR